MSAYKELETRFRRMGALGQATGMLHWDMSVMMPPGGAAARAEQLAVLKVLAHEMLTHPALGELLDKASGEQGLDDWQRANLHEMRRSWLHATAVPAALVEALTKASAASEQVWRLARPAADFKMLLPYMAEVLRLSRETAKVKAARLDLGLYDALLDQYEPGMRSARIDALFGGLAEFLPGFLARAMEAQAKRPPIQKLPGPFPAEKQRALGRQLMQALGFDFAHGRLDESAHPFTGGIPDDVRITTRYDEDDFTRGLMGVLHETGHALYERGLPTRWRLQPVGDARGMALHESQSLLMEMQACRSRGFVHFAAPLMRAAFDGIGPPWDAENVYRLYTRVEPGFIRVDADEVTYPAHVILRYRLERAMIAGDLDLADLPGAWNDGMKALLGITPPDDRLGCLQDIHWPDGAWGYFPTYTLGALAAAQLFQAAKRAEPAIEPGIARGDFRPLLAWLAANVHAKGSRATTDEIMQEATGAKLGDAAFRAHLQSRYIDDRG
ncbi:MAG: carboxypeptidase M32 [Alphaproteobacteria bacterium]|nr:carboxypeptidase M32 [Alphaproteobacteria bacterium]